MLSKENAARKKGAEKSVDNNNTKNKKAIKTFEIEENIPIPPRGSRDPETAAKINKIFATLKKDQSFVLPRNKLHTAQQIAKTKFPEMKIRTAVINPDKKFARIWRVS